MSALIFGAAGLANAFADSHAGKPAESKVAKANKIEEAKAEGAK